MKDKYNNQYKIVTRPHDMIAVDPGNESGGLSKREYFAAMAANGILSHPEAAKNESEDIAKGAVCIADALIKILNVETK